MTQQPQDRTPFDGTLVIDGKPTAVRWQFEGEGPAGSFVAFTTEGELLKIPLKSRFSFGVDWQFIQRSNQGAGFRVGFDRADGPPAEAVVFGKR